MSFSGLSASPRMVYNGILLGGVMDLKETQRGATATFFGTVVAVWLLLFVLWCITGT
jgi:hypothetical protein